MTHKLKTKNFILIALIFGISVIAIIFKLSVNNQTQIIKLPPPDQVGEVYDLVVVGSDPEGIAAAVSGARNGLAVLLVDSRPELGGLMTRGWLNSIDMNYGPGGEILNKGIFLEFYSQLAGDSFDVSNAVRVFNELVVREENLTVLLGVSHLQPVVQNLNGPAVQGVRFVLDGKEKLIQAQRVIDATQDGDIAAMAGVSYSLGQEDIGRTFQNMAVTLVFKLKNVSILDWLKIRYHLTFKDKKKSSGANRHSAWGFSEATYKYTPFSERLLLRGLNMGRQNDGSLLVNALLIFGVDPLDSVSRQQAKEMANNELPLVVKFLNQKVPGLEDAKLAGVAPELYVRESRHIYGKYRLTIDDVLENRDFQDRIAFGSYPVDMQPSGPGIPGVIIGKPQQYAVPFRCLVPEQVDGLLVAGRAASFDSLAHGSARTIPVGMAAGQSAGAAAALAIQNNISFSELSADTQLIKELQQRLNKQGMALQPFHIKNELGSHPAYAGLKLLRGLGLAAGGYDNDYALEQPISDQRFINILSQAVKQTQVIKQSDAVKEYPQLYPEANVFNIYDASYMLVRYLGLEMGKAQAFSYLQEQGFFENDKDYYRAYMNEKKPLSQGAGYMMINGFMTMLHD